MNIIIIILIFCIVLFLYLHIYYHFKTSNDLEVYEVTNVSKERFEEICNLRQPVIFNYNIDKLSNLSKEYILQNYGSFDQSAIGTGKDTKPDIFLPVSFKNGNKAIEEDENSKFISEKNGDFLEETSLIKILQANDGFIRPSLMSSYEYDYIMGSKNNITPLRYDMNYRNYILLLNGTIKIKMAPPKSEKYLYSIKDYDNFEFKSLINPWNIQDKYKANFDKIKCMEVTLEPGKIIFIPAYWWYSIKFEDNKSTVISFKYKTYINTLAILPNIFISFLQKQNIKHDIIKNVAKND